jgi:hypothetical protein
MKLTQEQKDAKKLLDSINAKKNQKAVKEISFSIEWKKSRMYGNNPTLTASICHLDGTRSNFTAKCSGYGYDKESTVIANLFNNCLSYILYNKDLSNAPYGISKHQNAEYLYYAGGVGTNCYYDIAEFIGAKLQKVGTGKTFDCFTLNFN